MASVDRERNRSPRFIEEFDCSRSDALADRRVTILLRADILSRLPILGIRRRRRVLADLITAVVSSEESAAVIALAHAVACSCDADTRDQAVAALERVRAPASIDDICEVWARTRNEDLAALLCRHSWVYSLRGAVRVFTALKTRQPLLLRDIGPDMLGAVIDALSDPDPVIAYEAQQAIIHLSDTNTRDLTCLLAIDDLNESLRAVVQSADYVPSCPDVRCLYLAAMGRWSELAMQDPHFEKLEKAMACAANNVRRNVIYKAFSDCNKQCIKLLLRSNAYGDEIRATSNLWSRTIDALRQQQRWNDLWELAFVAPAKWAAAILITLADQSWNPVTAASADFECLVQLARRAQRLPAVLGRWIRPYATMLGHTGYFESMTISEVHGLVATVSRDRTVRFWSLVNGREVSKLQDLPACPYQVTFHPTNATAAVACRDGTILSVSSLDGRVLERRAAATDGVSALEYSSSGDLLIARGPDSVVRAWAFPCLTFRHVIGPKLGGFRTFTTGRHHDLVALGSDLGTVNVYRLSDGTFVEAVSPNPNSVASLCFSPDGHVLAAGPGRDGSAVFLWQLGGGKLLHRLDVGTNWISRLRFAHDGATIVTQGIGRPQAWDCTTGQNLATFTHSAAANALCVAPNSRSVLIGESDGSIGIWNLSNGHRQHSIDGNLGSVSDLVLTSDSEVLVSASVSGVLRLWSLDLARLVDAPAPAMTREDIEFTHRESKEPDLAPDEEAWLRFLAALRARSESAIS
jgi:WD40 repeat protein